MSIVSVATKTTDLDGLPVLISISCGDRNIEIAIKENLDKMTPGARDCMSESMYKGIEANGMDALLAFSHVYHFITECDNPVFMAHNVEFETNILANFCEQVGYPRYYIRDMFHHIPQDLQHITMYLMNQTTHKLNSYKLTDLLDVFKIKRHHSKAVNQQKLYIEYVNLMDFGKVKGTKCSHCQAMTVEDGGCWLCGTMI